MKYIARVRVMPRAGILDPQGQAIEHALAALGFQAVERVRVGREVEITLDAAGEPEARAKLAAMGEKLLANPVTEDFVIDAVETAR